MTTPKRINKPTLITLIFIFSIILYIAGVYSGLYANTLLKEETSEQLENINSSTKTQIEGLKNSIVFLQTAIQEYQIEQDFIQTLPKAQECAAQKISLNNLQKHIEEYRQVLPFRLEEYEYKRNLSEEYIQVKEEYNKLSIQTWIVAKTIQDACDTNIVYALYLYDKNCVNCIRQGEELDLFTDSLIQDNKTVLLFTVDIDATNSGISLIKEQYGITKTPAILIYDTLYQGNIVSAEELLEGVS